MCRTIAANTIQLNMKLSLHIPSDNSESADARVVLCTPVTRKMTKDKSDNPSAKAKTVIQGGCRR